MKKPRKITAATFSQVMFLTFKYFLQNRLLSFAGACSFSFLFSIIPIFVMIAMVLIRILHASPKIVSSILNAIPGIHDYIDASNVIHLVESMNYVHSFEIFVGLFIFWMARRFFASVTDSLQNIFHNRTRRKALLNQIFTFLVELLTISTVSVVLFFYFSIGTLHFFDFLFDFLKNIPAIGFSYEDFSSGTINFFPDFLIFAVVAILYKTSAGTKPGVRLCVSSGFLCTLAFKIFRTALNAILNVGNYNLIYGVLSHAIILLMEIFFFFVFFLFFAQLIFSIQFFDELLLGELYLLPKIDKKGLGGKIKRLLFIRPDFLVASGSGTVALEEGETLFKAGGNSKNAFYISKGSMNHVYADKKTVAKQRGDFFGEVECVLGQKRKYSAKTAEKTELVKIKADSFKFLIHQNQEASRKVFRKIMNQEIEKNARGANESAKALKAGK